MSDKVNPKWLELGQQIRVLREAQGLSQIQLSKALTYTPAMLSAIERGIRKCNRDYLLQIDRALNSGGKLRIAWDDMQSNTIGLADWYRDFARLQQQATVIKEYQLAVIPGLVQTEEYARALIRVGNRNAPQAEIEQQVAARLAQQDMLKSARPPQLVIILEEAVLRRPICGHEAMGRQLDSLLHTSSAPHVVLQVVPMSTVEHPGLDCSFWLVKIPDHREVAYTETLTSGTPTDDVKEVEKYAHAFGEIRGAALAPMQSRELVERIRGDF